MTEDVGTIYVLANRDNSLAKIGLTRNGTPDTRADDYSRQHGIEWRVFWSETTANVAVVEASAHHELSELRFALVPGAREIFHITPQKAQRIVARYVVEPPKLASVPINDEQNPNRWTNYEEWRQSEDYKAYKAGQVAQREAELNKPIKEPCVEKPVPPFPELRRWRENDPKWQAKVHNPSIKLPSTLTPTPTPTPSPMPRKRGFFARLFG